MHCPTLSEITAPSHNQKGWPWTEESPHRSYPMTDGQPWPKISVVTPSYNQGEFIEKTIRSVLLQAYPDLEYIIVDGGSSDNSVEIIKKYGRWLTYWASERDKGQSNAINKGFQKATGVVYTWLNSDDYLLKDALRNVAVAYRALPDAGGWFGGCLQVNADGKILLTVHPKFLDAEHLAAWGDNAVTQPACFFSSKAWLKCGPLDESLHFGMDFDLWLKIAKEFPIAKVNEVLAVAVAHIQAKTQRDIGRLYAEHDVVRIRHGYDDLAIQDISKWVTDYMELGRRYSRLTRIPERVSRNPVFRPILPVARIIWRRLLRV